VNASIAHSLLDQISLFKGEKDALIQQLSFTIRRFQMTEIQAQQVHQYSAERETVLGAYIRSLNLDRGRLTQERRAFSVENDDLKQKLADLQNEKSQVIREQETLVAENSAFKLAVTNLEKSIEELSTSQPVISVSGESNPERPSIAAGEALARQSDETKEGSSSIPSPDSHLLQSDKASHQEEHSHIPSPRESLSESNLKKRETETNVMKRRFLTKTVIKIVKGKGNCGGATVRQKRPVKDLLSKSRLFNPWLKLFRTTRQNCHQNLKRFLQSFLQAKCSSLRFSPLCSPLRRKNEIFSLINHISEVKYHRFSLRLKTFEMRNKSLIWMLLDYRIRIFRLSLKDKFFCRTGRDSTMRYQSSNHRLMRAQDLLPREIFVKSFKNWRTRSVDC